MQKPVSVAHVERIEERVIPVAVGADTIEITEYKLQSTDFTPSPTGLPLKQGENKKGYQLSTKPQKHNSPILSTCIQTLTPSPTGLPLKQGENIASTTSVRSTRGVNISRHETDTTSTLRITLRPDTVYLPYTHHIRSDTIVVPDRICNEKLKQTKFMNVILLIFLILFVATIIYRKIFHK